MPPSEWWSVLAEGEPPAAEFGRRGSVPAWFPSSLSAVPAGLHVSWRWFGKPVSRIET